MGHVDVDVVDFGTYYPDSTCYYNTKLRLAAYPESGVEFKNWSDVTSNTDLIREITVTDNVTIKPVFEGTPTGIEDIWLLLLQQVRVVYGFVYCQCRCNNCKHCRSRAGKTAYQR